RPGRELRKDLCDDRPVGAPGMAAVDEERRLRVVAMAVHGIAAVGTLAIGHGLEQRGYRRAEQLCQVRAGFELADLAWNRFEPAWSDLLAHQALQDAVNLDAGRDRR